MSKVVNYLVAAAVSLTSVSAMADRQCGNLSGVYAGGNFGYGTGSGKSNSTNQEVTPAVAAVGAAPGQPAVTNTSSITGDAGVKGLRGGFHLGYGKLFPNKAYLGVEASADYSNTTGKTNINPATYSFQIKRRDAYGLALRLGGVMGAGMLTYAKVGVDTAKWKSTGSFLTTGGKQVSGGKTKRATGLVFGLGMETMIAQHLMLGGEWAYTAYNNAGNFTLVSPTDKNNTQSFKFKPHTSDFRLRLSYKW